MAPRSGAHQLPANGPGRLFLSNRAKITAKVKYCLITSQNIDEKLPGRANLYPKLCQVRCHAHSVEMANRSRRERYFPCAGAAKKQHGASATLDDTDPRIGFLVRCCG